MIVEHFILAQNSSIDADNNSLSVFQLLEDVTIQSPGEQVHFPIQAIVVLKREEQDNEVMQTDLTLRVQDPSGKDTFSKSIPIKMQKEHRRSRLRLNFNVLFDLSGEYRVIINKNDFIKENKEFTFHVNMVRQIQPQAPSPQSLQ